ncbi:alpha/beta hydrolase [Microbacterium sp. RG1]|uniref:alpha/beta hydrolase n=1 Tax=Microbacterium sp. RG1 TaxID=2489212 RepID=UPI0010CA461B|nr:alpha/beta hydrolase [Microbacterium sp. RG1]QCQ16605.1 alpha/beta hydrolase [Microbacterium sp. RG1]
MNDDPLDPINRLPLAGVWTPEYAERVAMIEDRPVNPLELTEEMLAEMEAFGRPFGAAEPTSARVTSTSVDGPHGPIPVRIYEPTDESGAAAGALLWLHGGGFIGGDLDMPEADAVARGLVTRAGVVVVSVDYRLCVGGVHHPVPHDDCWAAYLWLRQNAGRWGVPTDHVQVGGASAGGNLAASIALRARDEGVSPAAALLLYPVLHPRLPAPDAETAACLAQIPAPLRFPEEVTVAMNENFLGGPLSTADALSYPGLAHDLRGYCPTYIEMCEFDDLRPSGAAFASDLRAAGVEVTEVVAAGVPHGHLNAIGSRHTAATLDRMAAVLIRNGSGE